MEDIHAKIDVLEEEILSLLKQVPDYKTKNRLQLYAAVDYVNEIRRKVILAESNTQ